MIQQLHFQEVPYKGEIRLSKNVPQYIRTYVQADPNSNPKARRFKVGQPVWFVQRDHVSRSAEVVSHDRCYYRHRASSKDFIEGVDHYYTIRFCFTGRERKWVSAGQLRKG